MCITYICNNDAHLLTDKCFSDETTHWSWQQQSKYGREFPSSDAYWAAHCTVWQTTRPIIPDTGLHSGRHLEEHTHLVACREVHVNQTVWTLDLWHSPRFYDTLRSSLAWDSYTYISFLGHVCMYVCIRAKGQMRNVTMATWRTNIA